MPKSVSLSSWLSRNYLRVAIIPLFIIELIFLLVYWMSSNFIYNRNVVAIERISREFISDLAARQGSTLGASLRGIQDLTTLLAHQTREALATPHVPPAAERARYGVRRGAFVTLYGKDQSASFYSGVTKVGPEQIDRVWRLSQIDPALKGLTQANPLVSQAYFNGRDSYNRIYPYFDTWRQYAPNMRIPDYNFYYEADARHNPGRGPVWTETYLDPAGAGWMVSSIAPVYSPHGLEGVVGLDIPLKAMLQPIADMAVPWHGYAVLIGRDGTILTLPPQAERDFGITELGEHHYAGAVTRNIFKPARFNIRNRQDLQPLARALWAKTDATVRLRLGDRDMVVAHSHIAGTNWTLAIVAPASEIFADAVDLRTRLRRIGLMMAGALATFYILFLGFLYVRTKVLSEKLSRPLTDIGNTILKIGAGELDQPAPRSGVVELDAVSRSLVGMARGLSKAYATIAEQERHVSEALERERAITSAQRRFIDVVSHELRTPLTMIDSTAQILDRRAAKLAPDDVRDRAAIVRRAAARCENVLSSMLQLIRLGGLDGDRNLEIVAIDVAALLRDLAALAQERRPDHIFDTTRIGAAETEGDLEMLRTVFAAIIDNAARYSPPQSRIWIETHAEPRWCRVVISDQGPGIPPDELSRIGHRFYRGDNSAGTGGAGLGLFMANELIGLHGGRLDIRSAPDRGTEVEVMLPVQRTGAGHREPGTLRSASSDDLGDKHETQTKESAAPLGPAPVVPI